MIVSLPSILGLSTENIRQKIEFYDSINLHMLPIVDANELMQSVSLSYARYMFYKKINIDINLDNYRLLFMPNIYFSKKFNITKQELLKKYDYNKYLEEKNNMQLKK